MSFLPAYSQWQSWLFFYFIAFRIRPSTPQCNMQGLIEFVCFDPSVNPDPIVADYSFQKRNFFPLLSSSLRRLRLSISEVFGQKRQKQRQRSRQCHSCFSFM
jgi:hypothetical protein